MKIAEVMRDLEHQVDQIYLSLAIIKEKLQKLDKEIPGIYENAEEWINDIDLYLKNKNMLVPPPKSYIATIEEIRDYIRRKGMWKVEVSFELPKTDFATANDVYEELSKALQDYFGPVIVGTLDINVKEEGND